MNLYLAQYRDEFNPGSYSDAYDGFVIAAESPEHARKLAYRRAKDEMYGKDWLTERVTVRQIGVALRKTPGIMLASFRAG